MVESKSKFKRVAEECDVINFTHETRYDNGQLVELDERRKAKEKFIMNSAHQHEHFRQAFLTMCKGEVAWLKMSPKVHKNMYHKMPGHHVDTSKIGESIFLKLFVDTLKRDPQLKPNQPYKECLAYFDKIQELCKELVTEGEFTNAKNLYSRCLGPFKNLPKKQREELSEEDNAKRTEIMLKLNMNMSLCWRNLNKPGDAVKHANDAKDIDPTSSKAWYRLFQAYKQNSDLDLAKESLKQAIQLEP